MCFYKILLVCLHHFVVLVDKMGMQTGPGIEAFQELSWLGSTSDISSFPLPWVLCCLFQKQSLNNIPKPLPKVPLTGDQVFKNARVYGEIAHVKHQSLTLSIEYLLPPYL